MTSPRNLEISGASNSPSDVTLAQSMRSEGAAEDKHETMAAQECSEEYQPVECSQKEQHLISAAFSRMSPNPRHTGVERIAKSTNSILYKKLKECSTTSVKADALLKKEGFVSHMKSALYYAFLELNNEPVNVGKCQIEFEQSSNGCWWWWKALPADHGEKPNTPLGDLWMTIRPFHAEIFEIFNEAVGQVTSLCMESSVSVVASNQCCQQRPETASKRNSAISTSPVWGQGPLCVVLRTFVTCLEG